MKTVCVVTWYKSNNFGTCLQAVALVKALEEMGYNAYMLAYGRRYTLKDWERILRKLKKKFRAEKGAKGKTNSEKENNIQRCIDENLSFVSVKTKEEQRKTFEKIDCFVVGSDQVWNPDHFDEVYLLDFVPDNIRKISYASSIGVEQLPETLKGKYKKYLKRFDSISVRESKAADVIEKLVNKPVDVVLDPTFLLDGISWHLFAQKAHLEKNLPQKYILTYFVGNHISHWEEVKIISQATGLPVVVLPLENTDCGDDFLRCETAGTYEFVALIRFVRNLLPIARITLKKVHVRFIAINDDFDNIRQSDVDSLAVPIKNMVNSLYAKDISKKISLSYQMRREKGIPTSWCTPYGYQLNQQGNKFEATEDAKWVKLIYQWYLAGVSTNEIARRLEFLEVARPNERLNRKLHEGDDPTYNKWHPSTVLRILNSSAYIGELVSGKTQTASYKGIGLHPVEKKEWHIVENAHEAIILKSDFEKVQARREQNKERRERAMARSKATREKCYNHLSGMVYCGCCRRNMTFERRVHGTVKETHYGVFICKRKKNTTPCAYHAVPEKMLMMVAMDQIHHLVSTMCEEEKMVKDMMRGSNLDSARSIKMKENSILFRIQEAEERRLRLYEDYKAEILDEDEYSQLKEHYIAEKQRLEHELQKQRQRALELEKRIKICDAQMERMRGILNQNEFDEELVHELIKRIYVGMDNSVEVEFKCSDPYQEVLAIMSEVQNE